MQIQAADAPGSDRPGLGFDPSTLTSGSVAIEQGLPDLSRDSSGGINTTRYAADTLVRIGLHEHVELQLATTAYNVQHVSGASLSHSEHGRGDSSIGLKVSMPSRDQNFAWGLLATATLPTGQTPFGGDARTYDVGAVMQWTLVRDRAISIYLDRSISAGDTTWLAAANLNVPLNEHLQGYVEAGMANGGDNRRVVGTGLAWLIADRVQLDASLRRGLDRDSADWQGGFGASVYFP